jgi:hypothetical protein
MRPSVLRNSFSRGKTARILAIVAHADANHLADLRECGRRLLGYLNGVE